MIQYIKIKGGGSFGFGARPNDYDYDNIMYDKCEDENDDEQEMRMKFDKMNVGTNNYSFWKCCPGLNYCGKCLNRNCKAFNQPIIMNRGFGINILPLMEYKDNKILCPGCKQKFELNAFTLYSCDAKLKYRLINGESKELIFKPRRNEYIDCTEIKEYGMFELTVCFVGQLNKESTL